MIQAQSPALDGRYQTTQVCRQTELAAVAFSPLEKSLALRYLLVDWQMKNWWAIWQRWIDTRTHRRTTTIQCCQMLSARKEPENTGDIAKKSQKRSLKNATSSHAEGRNHQRLSTTNEDLILYWTRASMSRVGQMAGMPLTSVDICPGMIQRDVNCPLTCKGQLSKRFVSAGLWRLRLSESSLSPFAISPLFYYYSNEGTGDAAASRPPYPVKAKKAKAKLAFYNSHCVCFSFSSSSSSRQRTKLARTLRLKAGPASIPKRRRSGRHFHSGQQCAIQVTI